MIKRFEDLERDIIHIAATEHDALDMFRKCGCYTVFTRENMERGSDGESKLLLRGMRAFIDFLREDAGNTEPVIIYDFLEKMDRGVCIKEIFDELLSLDRVIAVLLDRFEEDEYITVLDGVKYKVYK